MLNQYGRKPNTPQSLFSAKPKLPLLSYENITNHYVDEDTVTLEDIVSDDKWINSYMSGIEVEMGMTRATRDSNNVRGRAQTGSPDFFALELANQFPSRSDWFRSNWLER